MPSDDPTATYRGYRRQALYALFRLFDDALPTGAIIQPEGNEDLAIYDAVGTLIEIVQVKDYTTNLVASSFKPSFYKRIAPYCIPGSRTTVRVASFGPIGPDLSDAASGDRAATDRVLKTLTKEQKAPQKRADGSTDTVTIPGLPESDAKNIVTHLTLTPVAEALHREAARAQPVLQELFDACAELLAETPELDDDILQARPNIAPCMQLIIGMKDALYPTGDFDQQAELSVRQIVDWRDRLHAALPQLAVARYLWIADSLGFPEWTGIE